MTRRVLRRVVLSFIALFLGLGIGLVALGFTPALAAACPACFGFVKVADGVYSETADPMVAPELVRRVEVAESRVEAAFGAVHRPRILVCYTDTCHKMMGDIDPLAMTYGSLLFYLSPHGHDIDIIAHEFVHSTLHKQLGARLQAGFPAWVDEGISVYVSRDSRFDLNPETCDAGVSPMPTTAKDWLRENSAQDFSAYGRAGCRVARWLAEHPEAGLEGLIGTYVTASD
ncbi:hypothetical protein [Celeribacter marinus]|uniref:hypothetical protein n=1 Tax=Celeribacter marinus TaxID=1397108 RepID=UPI00318193A2